VFLSTDCLLPVEDLDLARLDPPQTMPNYFSELSQAVMESQVWIAAGGLAVDDTLGPADSNGESEVDDSPSHGSLLQLPRASGK